MDPVSTPPKYFTFFLKLPAIFLGFSFKNFCDIVGIGDILDGYFRVLPASVDAIDSLIQSFFFFLKIEFVSVIKKVVQSQWGSEIWPFKIWKHLKSQLFEGRISNGMFFKWSALAMAIALVPTIWKLDRLKTWHFSLDFTWFLTKWQPFVRIINGWPSRFQIP